MISGRHITPPNCCLDVLTIFISSLNVLGKGVNSGGCRWGGERGKGGCNTPSPLHFLTFVGILTKCVGKISKPNVVDKFGGFYHKKTNCRIPSISNPAEIKHLPAMAAFKGVI